MSKRAAPDLAGKSAQTERERPKPLCAAFGDTRLNKISVDMVRRYISDRKTAGIANKTINLELRVFRGTMKRARLWQVFAEDINPLPTTNHIGRAMTIDEKLKLTRTAATKPEWQNAQAAMILSLNTTMRSCEIKGLHWHDVDLLDRSIMIVKSKTKAGQRVIPLNEEAFTVLKSLRSRASQLGPIHPFISFFLLARTATSIRASRRRAGALPGEASGRLRDYLHYDFTIFVTMRLQN